jgi:hypothetical protein
MRLLRRPRLVTTILAALAAALLIRPLIDPDLWWHLKVGRQLLEGVFPDRNHLSPTLADYRWINHEWLTDGVMYLLYDWGGLLLLAAFFTTIFGLAFAVAARTPAFGVQDKSPRSPRLALIVFCSGLLVAQPIIGTRPQMITLLLFALAQALLVAGRLRWLPLLFFAWVNLHGGYAVGLGLWGLVLLDAGVAWLRDRSAANGARVRGHMWFLGLSLLACLINPFGWRIFEETLRTATDAFAKANIVEWLPLSFQSKSGLVSGLYAFGLLFGLLAARLRPPRLYYLVLPAFLYLGFSSVRHFPLFVLVSLPLLRHLLAQQPLHGFLTDGLDRLFGRRGVLPFTLNATMVVFLTVFPLLRLGSVIRQAADPAFLAEAGNFPDDAVDFLRRHPPGGTVFNSYGWGGYLLWHLPDAEIFIDGRMASWHPPDEPIFRMHADVLKLEGDWQATLNRYNITHILVESDSTLAGAAALLPAWREVYRDDLAVIYRREPDTSR